MHEPLTGAKNAPGMQLALGLLGPFISSLDDKPIGFEYNKVRALLAYLLIEQATPQRRDHLIGLLWPDLPERVARQNLSQALLSLRHSIHDHAADPPFLLINRDTVQWNRASSYQLDVAIWTALLDAADVHPHRHPEACRACAQRWEQAALLYRGDLLAQFFLGDSDNFDSWLRRKSDAIRARMLTALRRLTAFYEQRGQHDQVVRWATRQLEIEPWREEAHRQLMRAFAAVGQWSAALAQYQRCVRVLQDELDASPEPVTIALWKRIRDHQLPA